MVTRKSSSPMKELSPWKKDLTDKMIEFMFTILGNPMKIFKWWKENINWVHQWFRGVLYEALLNFIFANKGIKTLVTKHQSNILEKVLKPLKDTLFGKKLKCHNTYSREIFLNLSLLRITP